MNALARRLEHLRDHAPSRDDFAAAVLAGLHGRPKTLPCRFFYDAQGSRLFDRITTLPEYYPTRAECEILESEGQDIGALIGRDATIVEYGSGAARKIRLLLGSLDAPKAYVPIDISRSALTEASQSLVADFPDLVIQPVCADYTEAVALPPAAGMTRRVGFFPGSTIGNFTPAEARKFLKKVHADLGGGALFLVGVDLVKETTVLEAAYDDPDGVTARFNLNVLKRINDELQGTIDLAGFAHEARFDEALGRIEMHLVSLSDQSASIMGEGVAFAAGETIHTENSYKYRPDSFRQLAASSGFGTEAMWTDRRGWFGMFALRAR